MLLLASYRWKFEIIFRNWCNNRSWRWCWRSECWCIIHKCRKPWWYSYCAATGAVIRSGGFTAHGRITLTSTDGSSIRVTDDQVDRLAGAGGVGRIGFESTNEHRSDGATGVVVSAVDSNKFFGGLDEAIETVSRFRAGFGAYENRLEAQ